MNSEINKALTQNAPTPEQEKAINHEKGSIMVSASAGSGKTRVMITRIARLIQEKKTTVDKIVAMTFTDAAALEMKERLKKALVKTVRETGDKDVLRQLSLVSVADISTIHSFCMRLIQTYFYEAGVSPDFKILGDEDRKLAEKAMDKTFTTFYKEKDQDFLKVVERFAKRRSDAELRVRIKNLYEKLSERAEFDQLLELSIKRYQKEAFYGLVDLKRAEFVKEMEKNLHELRVLKHQLESDYDAPKLLSVLTEAIGVFEFAIQNGARESAKVSIGNRGEKGELVKPIRGEIVEKVKECSALMDEYAIYHRLPEELEEERVKMLKQTTVLVNLVKAYRENFKQLKRDENLLDFSDLQYITLELLKKDEIRKAVQGRYDYVFVDEYQDVNTIQSSIIEAVSNDNLFCVGDDKQCIYAFRGCNPDFFAEKFEKMRSEGKATVELNRNFRSAENVIDAVNDVFNYCMTKSAYGYDYEKRSQLEYGGRYPDRKGRFSAHYIPKKIKADKKIESPRVYDVLEELDNEDGVSIDQNSALIVKIIEEELDKTFFNPDTKTDEPVKLSDIVVLTRKGEPQDVVNLVKALKARGVPVVSGAEDLLLSHTEVITLYEILKAINCTKQDVPLYTVLRSVIGGFTDEEMLSVKRFFIASGGDKDAPFYTVYKYYIENANDALRDKLIEFDQRFYILREKADYVTAGEMLNLVLREYDYEASVYAMRFGKQRVKRVREFVEFAESVGNKSVGEFIDLVEKTSDTITASQSEEDAVRVMTMHSSKGLEFPVVIVEGLQKPLKKNDDAFFTGLDEEYGVLSKYFDDQKRVTRGDIWLTEYSKKYEREVIKEEMRLFYVALTRATYSLHLVSNDKPNENLSFTGAKKFSDYVPPKIGQAGEEFSAEATMEVLESAKRHLVIFADADKSATNTINELSQKIKANVTFVYPNLVDTELPLKSTVTEASKTAVAEDGSLMVNFENDEKFGVDDDRIERGVVAHKVMELFDFNSSLTLYEQVDNMVFNGVLTREQVEKIDLKKIGVALENNAFNSIQGGTLYREKSFIANFTAKEVFDKSSDASILVQGVIDLLVVKDGRAIIFDYKYSQKSAERLKATYSKQLNLYASAVERVLGLSVEGKILINLQTGESVEIV